jgi:hypothetical protein
MNKLWLTLLLITPVLAQTSTSRPYPGVSEQIGRYQLAIGGDGEFMIDTASGKTWQRKIFTFISPNPQAWVYMDRIDNEGQLIEFEQQKIKEAAATH